MPTPSARRLKPGRRAASRPAQRGASGLSGADASGAQPRRHDRSAPLAARRPDRRPPRARAGAGRRRRGAAAARRARSRLRPPAARGRFGAAVAGGLVSATLVSAGAFGLGVIDSERPARRRRSARRPAPPSRPKQQGDVAAIYTAASPAVVSVRTGGGSGTGFVVDTDGTVVTNAHVVGDSDQVELQFSDDRTVDRRGARRRHAPPTSRSLHVDPARAGQADRAASSPTRAPCAPASSPSRSARRSGCRRPRPPASCPAPAATSRRRTASRSTR